MSEPKEKPRIWRVIVAGVGGQGTVTLAQVLMEVATRSAYYALQSEIHGMSQRGGMVYAYLCISAAPITSPIVMEATGDLLIGVEPLEAMRYVHLLRRDAPMVVSTERLETIDDYPAEDSLYESLRAIPGIVLVDTAAVVERFRFKQAGGVALLGVASRTLPFDVASWHAALRDRFAAKGERVVAKNLAAFDYGVALP
ncbi:MAG: 2-oxoacid:acceptor oxidoreductase family protein [Myxococcales bacterium]|nr:2-oxoacid:acceptor oxidoreductase family protein [Myxococcales bacterium]